MLVVNNGKELNQFENGHFSMLLHNSSVLHLQFCYILVFASSAGGSIFPFCFGDGLAGRPP